MPRAFDSTVGEYRILSFHLGTAKRALPFALSATILTVQESPTHTTRAGTVSVPREPGGNLTVK